jgi:hypothetical protein
LTAAERFPTYSPDIMRTEISNVVEEMKQSIGLLRRHL